MVKVGKKLQCFDRSAGILMSVSSLPSNYGIGTFGKAAYEFVDFVKKCHHKFWQVLPLGPTTYGDSPYQSYSAFAGNPYFIDPDILVEEGLLTKSYLLSIDWGDGKVPAKISEEELKDGTYTQATDIGLGNECYVSYEKMYQSRFMMLRKAFEEYKKVRSASKLTLPAGLPEYKKFDNFVKANADWIYDYALFMAVKEHFGGVVWSEWDEDIRFRTKEGIAKYQELLSDDIDFWMFVQYEFDKQWSHLKAYANNLGIEIIGDIPIYMGYDSADVWSQSRYFQLDEKLCPTKVAGVPPDAFSDLGQKWGNPLYDWETLEKDDFSWWYRRMRKSAQLYDVIRIDHFIGIVKYYTIPADMPDARQGEYCVGPGSKLTEVINKAIGDKKIIAEDLGVPVPEVNELLEENNYPGMKVLEFAFGGDRKNPHLPYNYTKNCVVYGGTHDNETLMGYFLEHEDWDLGYAYDYLDTKDKEKMVDQVFRMAYGSVADLVIFAVQDILKLGNWARMNTPSTLGTNWKWRMKKGELTDKHIQDMCYLASVFGRE